MLLDALFKRRHHLQHGTDRPRVERGLARRRDARLLLVEMHRVVTPLHGLQPIGAPLCPRGGGVSGISGAEEPGGDRTSTGRLEKRTPVSLLEGIVSRRNLPPCFTSTSQYPSQALAVLTAVEDGCSHMRASVSSIAGHR